MKNIEAQVYVYGLVDSHGNKWVGVVDDPGDTIMVYGLYDADGDRIRFEDEACHLEDLTTTYGLLYGERKQWVNVDVDAVVQP